MTERQKGKNVYLLNPNERKVLRRKKAEGEEKKKFNISRIQESYFKLDKTTKTYLEDLVLLTKNFKYLPARISADKKREIAEKEETIKEQLLASFLEAFYELKFKPETKKKAIKKAVDDFWEKARRTENWLEIPERTKEQIQSIKEKHVKPRHEKFVPFLIKMRILREEHSNTLFSIDKQRNLSAVDYCRENEEWKEYTLGSCDAKKEVFMAPEHFVDKLQKMRLINKIKSVKFNSETDDLWDHYEFTFSPLGYLISLVGDKTFEDTFVIKYALDLVIRDIYTKPDRRLFDKWIREIKKQECNQVRKKQGAME